jgi:hypothetical protein
LNEHEIACIKRLAQLYDLGQIQNGSPWQEDPKFKLGIPEDKWISVLGTMEHCGAIDSVDHAEPIKYWEFRILPRAVQLARQIHDKENEKKEPDDMVDKIQNAARQNSFVAWLIICFLVVTALVSVVSNSITILEKLGIITTATQK